jgi:hypothetical protein
MKNKIPHLILAGLFGVSTAHATTIVMDDANFSRLFNTDQAGSGGSISTHTLVVGTKSNGSGQDHHAGIAFQMTVASAADLLVADFANFSISRTGGQGTPIYNVDVYANRVSSASTFLVSDFENGTKLMDDFLTPSDGVGNYSLDATGQANLLSYLQNNWVEDDYVFITLKADTDPNFIMGEDANANYNFGGAVGAWSAGALDAQLIVTVPEPSSTALLGLGGLALMLRRKRS